MLRHFEPRHRIAQVVLITAGPHHQGIAVQRVAVQPRNMAGIDPALHRLQPVAILQPLRHETLRGGHRREFVVRQPRPVFGRPHIGPQHAAALDQRIGAQRRLLAEAGLIRFGRQVHALAGHVVFPAVIGAADAAFFIAAEPQRHTAVGAEFLDQAQPALGVAKRQQLFGQQLNPHRRAVIVAQFPGQQGGDPVAAEHRAHRRAGRRPGQQVILFRTQHVTQP